MKESENDKNGRDVSVESSDLLAGLCTEDLLMTDEEHIARALYMLQRAVAGRGVIEQSEMHALLRDASIHCEAARRHWTTEARERIETCARNLFG